MKLIKFDVLLLGNLGFRLILNTLLVYVVLGITLLETIKGTNLIFLYWTPKFMSSEHKVSGTVRACVRESSQTAWFNNLFFIEKRKQRPVFLQRPSGGVNLPAVPATGTSQSIPLHTLSGEKLIYLQTYRKRKGAYWKGLAI